MWLNLASAQDQKAGELRDLIATKMTPEQIAEAQGLARKWKPDETSTGTKKSLPFSGPRNGHDGPSAAPASSESAAGGLSNVDADIRSLCEEEWGSDYRMSMATENRTFVATENRTFVATENCTLLGRTSRAERTFSR